MSPFYALGTYIFRILAGPAYVAVNHPKLGHSRCNGSFSALFFLSLVGNATSESTIEVGLDLYNVYNSRLFHWSELLATLKRSGFQFQTLPFVDWLQLLRKSKARGEENFN
jgi:hypothetical protein